MIDIFRAHMEYNCLYGALEIKRFAEYANHPSSIYTHEKLQSSLKYTQKYRLYVWFGISLFFFKHSSVVQVRYDVFFLYHGHFSCNLYFKMMYKNPDIHPEHHKTLLEGKRFKIRTRTQQFLRHMYSFMMYGNIFFSQ